MSPILPLRPLPTLSDARLVELVHGGHERAFDVLVRRYRRQLLAYAGRLLGAEGRAEDALQQAFVQAWIALRAGAELDDVRAWLYRIVHNSAVNILRRARHDCVELNESLDTPPVAPEHESRLAMRELFSSLAALPELQRRAILLTAVDGRSHDEVAAALGVTDGAVRGLVYRARASMRSAVAGLMPVGLVNWLTGLGSRRSSFGTRATELAGAGTGAGSAGIAACVLKGGAIVASVGALASAGQLVIPGSNVPHHHGQASSRSIRGPGSASASARTGTGGSPSASSATTANRTAATIPIGFDSIEGRGRREDRRNGHDLNRDRGGRRGVSGRDDRSGRDRGGSGEGSSGSGGSGGSGGEGGVSGGGSSGSGGSAGGVSGGEGGVSGGEGGVSGGGSSGSGGGAGGVSGGGSTGSGGGAGGGSGGEGGASGGGSGGSGGGSGGSGGGGGGPDSADGAGGSSGG